MAHHILFGIEGRQAVKSFIAAIILTAWMAPGAWAADGDVTVDLGMDDGTSVFSVVDASGNERLEMADDGTVVIRGDYGAGAALTESGAGTRLVWYPMKAAFRAGMVEDDHWDDANIGSNSIALGRNTRASGSLSTAIGPATTASGNNSTAIGRETTASGDGSTAIGRDSTASSNFSMAFGYQTTASGGGATAMGWGTTASGNYSMAMGCNTEASGFYATAMGDGTTAQGHRSTSMGLGTTAQHFGSVVLGKYNLLDATAHTGSASVVGTDYLFAVGNGADDGNRSNAMAVLNNGHVQIPGDLTVGGTFSNPSDIRWKKNIAQITDPLSKVDRLSGVSFSWNREDFPQKSFSDERQIGLIAQDVETVLPELVHTDHDGYKSVEYAKLSAVLVEAVKELNARNQALEDQAHALKAQNQALEERLAKLEALAADR